MSKFGRFVAVSAALAAFGLGGAAIASADTTGGAGGYWDTDGTQGEMKEATQGEVRSGGQGSWDDDGIQGSDNVRYPIAVGPQV